VTFARSKRALNLEIVKRIRDAKPDEAWRTAGSRAKMMGAGR
jgi:hypothetical protein